MNALGYQFFPSAAFAQEQDGILMLADLLDHLVHALHYKVRTVLARTILGIASPSILKAAIGM